MHGYEKRERSVVHNPDMRIVRCLDGTVELRIKLKPEVVNKMSPRQRRKKVVLDVGQFNIYDFLPSEEVEDEVSTDG